MSIPTRRAAATPPQRALAPVFAVAAGVLAFASFGCQQQSASGGGASPAPAASAEGGAGGGAAVTGPFKVALITPGSVADKGWNGAAAEGLTEIKAKLGAETTPPVEGPAPSEVAGAIRNLAQAGNQLVFLHGSEYDEPAATVSADFPKTTFVVDGGRTEKANLFPIDYSGGQATFLAGMLAGGMTKTGKVACVGAAEIPIVKDAFASFEKGVKYQNPKATVTVVFTGDENDTSKAKQTTQSLLSQGADVVLHNANAAGQGVAQAVSEKPGAMFLGANTPQDDLATAQNLGSFVLDVPGAYVAVAQMVKDGKADGKKFSWGLDKNANLLHYNPGFKGTIPADLKAKIEQAGKDIAAGKIDVTPGKPVSAAPTAAP